MLLNCRNVQKSFGDTEVLGGVSFDLQEREFLCLLGPSGCGKTTLLRIIAGLESLNSGEVQLNDSIISGAETMVPPQQRQIGLVFQDVALFPHLTVAQNIAFGLKSGIRQNQKRIDELLELIGLSGYGGSYPHEMSGGQQQRVALARALALSPKLILLDEPFSSLDAQLRNQVRDELHSVLTDAGVSAILVTHDQSEAFGFSDRILVLNESHVVQEGSPQDIYQSPASPWVAKFVGESNFLKAGDLIGLLDRSGEPSGLDSSREFLVRPEAFSINPANCAEHNAVIETVKFGGNHQKVTATLKHSSRQVELMSGAEIRWENGQPVNLQVLRYQAF